MRLLFVVNLKSGRGRAASLAEQFEAAAISAGHAVHFARIGTGAEPRDLQWPRLMADHDVAVIFGGDGTVHSLLRELADGATRLYHVPTGTENLFARHFGMTSSPDHLLAAIAAGSCTVVDLGEANGRHFAIMCTVGPDASVVERLASRRTGAIRHSSYIQPILRELSHPALGPISFTIDGKEVVHDQRGLLVVANSPMYALGLNPAREAVMTDGLLDVVFLPASSSPALAIWYARAFLGSPLRSSSAIFRRGTEVVVRSRHRAPYQLDGDMGGCVGPAEKDLVIHARPAALRILTPPTPSPK